MFILTHISAKTSIDNTANLQQANFDDFSEHESDNEVEPVDDPYVLQDQDGNWSLRYLGMSVSLPHPRKTGLGRWIVEMDPADRICSVTDGVRTRLASNMVTLERAKMFLSCL